MFFISKEQTVMKRIFLMATILLTSAFSFGQTFIPVKVQQADKLFNGEKENLAKTSEVVWEHANFAVSATDKQRKEDSFFQRQQLKKMSQKLHFKFNRALDAGTGLGQNADYVLIPLFKDVDVADRSLHMIDKSLARLGSKVRNYYHSSLQDLHFEHKYDFIKVDAVLLYLSDTNIVIFLKNAKKSLTKDGVIEVFEPVSIDDKLYVKKSLGAVFRTEKLWNKLIKKAGLQIVDVRKQSYPKIDQHNKSMTFYLR